MICSRMKVRAGAKKRTGTRGYCINAGAPRVDKKKKPLADTVVDAVPVDQRGQ